MRLILENSLSLTWTLCCPRCACYSAPFTLVSSTEVYIDGVISTINTTQQTADGRSPCEKAALVLQRIARCHCFHGWNGPDSETLPDIYLYRRCCLTSCHVVLFQWTHWNARAYKPLSLAEVAAPTTRDRWLTDIPQRQPAITGLLAELAESFLLFAHALFSPSILIWMQILPRVVTFG